MKKRIGVFILLLFASSFVFAMDDPILVKTSPGNYVKIYAWPSSGGPLLNLGEGSVNNEGLFSHTFFSLHEPTIKYQVLIIKNGEKIIDESFDNQGINNPLEIDCRSGDSCSISILDEGDILNVNETAPEEPQETETASEEPQETLVTGLAFYNKSDGTLNLIYPIGLVVVLLLSIVLFIFFKKKKRFGGVIPDKEDEDDKQLREVESRIKEKEKEINTIKYSELKKRKIKEAKNKLVQEEKELRDLGGGEKSNNPGNNPGNNSEEWPRRQE